MLTSTKQILIIGKHGQLARCLKATQPPGIDARFVDRHQLDITKNNMLTAITKSQYQLVINCSGYTAVDAAESDRQAVFDVNHLGVTALAKQCAAQQVKLIHMSSDYVFDGHQPHPYRINDTPNPLSNYGKSKWAGEQAILSMTNLNATIVRSAWLYSPFGNNFVKTMLTLMRQGRPLRVIDDQFGSPTSCLGLAQFIWRLTQQQLSPIYHWSDVGVTSWFRFAQHIAACAHDQGLLHQSIDLKPIDTSGYQAAAQRPAYSALDNSMSQQILEAKPWQENLSSVIHMLGKEF